MFKGTVKWFSQKKGYGFIRSEEGVRDIFVHASSVKDNKSETLSKGDIVTFDISKSRKGPVAVNVILLIKQDLKN